MKLGQDQVKHVAKLADLPLSEEEGEKYLEQLSKILDYIDQLNQVDTSSIEPTFNVSKSKNITQENKMGTCFTQEEALFNAPVKKKGLFVTKGIFSDE